MKRYEKNAFIRFFSLFFSAFMLMFVLLGTLYYFEEYKRLSSDREVENSMIFIECSTAGVEDNCILSTDNTPNMQETYKNILYVFGLVFLIFVPISLTLSLFSIRPVRTASTMIDNFIANIVHDINTPIATIVLNSNSLIKTSEINPIKLKRILSSAKQLSDMQHDLLALADEKEIIELENIEIKSIIEDIVEGFRLQYPSQDFELNLHPSTLLLNLVDFRRITQNLLSNAIKYNRNENLIKIYHKDKNLIIEDAGKGMEHPEKVFDKNYREDYTIQGNGLGLASVLSMLKRNHIKIDVSSQLGIGTEITLVFEEKKEKIKK
ncbi:MAG: HAMP domain-containing histidine kinase [Sulfurovaceae bacterium]|nr:HAMP domain-containing histidine kinase [Sulfurovaceae bacterium]